MWLMQEGVWDPFLVFDLTSTTKDPLSTLNNNKFQRYSGTKGMQDSQIIESFLITIYLHKPIFS